MNIQYDEESEVYESMYEYLLHKPITPKTATVVIISTGVKPNWIKTLFLKSKDI